MSTDLQQQFVHDMLTESQEGLDRYDRAILLVESGTANKDTLNDIFRVIHTLKGTAGCLGFHQIEKLAHAGENLLDPIRSGTLQPTPDIASTLLRLSDELRALLSLIESSGGDQGGADPSGLIKDLITLREGGSISAVPSAPPPAAANAAPEEGAGAWGLFEDTPASPAPTAEPVNSAWGLFDAPADVPATAPTTSVESTPAAASLAVVPSTVAAPAAGASVRVDVGLLDKLMNLVGELVLSRNQLVQLAQNRQVRQESVSEVSQRLNLVTSELQEGVMKTRMQPIGNVWAKFPRIVRDIARELGKQVRLETIGAETELDRTIVESIRDPLTHIIRNSIDHGIESPEKRLANGKGAEGCIIMRAFHEGGQVNIEIIDDGAGINLSRVREKALEKGLIDAESAARMSERDVTNLIFLPGFSTAEKITNVSGRGVGMDVVKTNIEKIGGSVDIQSASGQGTTLRIKIPLTLAIVPALIVRAAGERFAIPQVNLHELVRLEGNAAKEAMENVYGAPVFRLRGQLLPLVFLHRELKLPPPQAEISVINIIVLQADHRSFGLVVDTVCDTEEIVVKPLGQQLKGLPMFAGATIMGDGRVALILDVVGLAQYARVLGSGSDRHKTITTEAAVESRGPTSQLLLFSIPGRNRLAVPLEQAARLEEFTSEQVELSGAREAVQYRGKILPLLRLARQLPAAGAPAERVGGPLQVIVYQQAGHNVGLVVGEIHDIIEDTLEIQPGTASTGILGSAVIQGKITDLVDVPGLLRSAGIVVHQAA